TPWFGAGFELACGWGARGSWWWFRQAAEDREAVNSNPSLLFASVSPLPTFGFASPAPYQFQPLLPTNNLVGTPLPSFTFPSGVHAGLPDHFTFSSNLSLQVADLELTHYAELGQARGTISMGVRWADIRQDYSAYRRGTPGVVGLDGYNPFGPLLPG